MLLAIRVTDHALFRYRERVAEFADAPACEVAERVRESVRENPYPNTVIDYGDGKEIRYHRDLDCVFVCNRDEDCLTVITVRRPSAENRNYLHPKLKQPRLNAAELKDMDEIHRLSAELAPEFFPSVEAEMAWWTGRFEELQSIGRKYKTGNPVREAMYAAKREFVAKIARLREVSTTSVR